MLARGTVLRLGLLAAIAALAVFAFVSGGATQKAHAVGPQASCTFATPLHDLLPAGGSDSVTCTFNVHGTTHTVVVDFTLTPTAVPPLSIDGCTLDGSPIHVGPCP